LFPWGCGTQIFRWSTAGDAGKLDVVYYQTPYYDGTSTPDNYPMSGRVVAGICTTTSVSPQARPPVSRRSSKAVGGGSIRSNRPNHADAA